MRSTISGPAGLGFVIPDFASRIARIEQGKLDKLEVGNLSAQRDFSDVRDIVCGYALLMEKGAAARSTHRFGHTPANIDILKLLLSFSDADIEVFEDPAKMRPSDAPLIYGDCTKNSRDVGYQPERRLEITLKEILEYWRGAIAADRRRQNEDDHIGGRRGLSALAAQPHVFP